MGCMDHLRETLEKVPHDGSPVIGLENARATSIRPPPCGSASRNVSQARRCDQTVTDLSCPIEFKGFIPSSSFFKIPTGVQFFESVTKLVRRLNRFPRGFGIGIFMGYGGSDAGCAGVAWSHLRWSCLGLLCHVTSPLFMRFRRLLWFRLASLNQRAVGSPYTAHQTIKPL